MSLPSGLVNRPAVVAPRPAVVGGMWRVAWRALALLLPLLLHAAIQVPGVRWQYECSQLERAIGEQRLERRRLNAERSRLLCPTRLRKEAARLGLVPASLGPLGPDAPRRELASR